MAKDSGDAGSDDKKLDAMINSSGDIAGGAIGAAVGFIFGGPAGAALGGASGPAAAGVIRKIGHEATRRLLGPREEVRIGGALAIATAHIKARVDRGEKLRTDGFFENRHSGRSDAEEVAESVLQKSQHEAEERKIPFMAYLIGNVAFNSGISTQLAHQILKAADSMTYRQLCIMKLTSVSKNYPLRTDYKNQTSFNRVLYQILHECLDLERRALINFDGKVAFGLTDVRPATMRLEGLGIDMFNEMGLVTIPEVDFVDISERLSE